MRQEYFVYQVSYFKPLLLRLEKYGVDVACAVRKTEIKHFELSNPKNYIPIGVVHEFLVALKKECKSENLTTCFSSNFCLSEFGDFGTHVSTQPTLKKAINEFIKFNCILQTNLKIDLKIDNKDAILSFSFLDQHSKGGEMSECITLGILCQLLNMYTGSKWKPLEIHLANNTISEVRSLLPKGEYKIKDNRSEYRIIFSESILASKAYMIPLNSGFIHEYQGVNITNVIENVVSSYKCGCIPSLTTLSSHFNTSESSMKRLLKSNQTKFSNILGNILYSRAVDLLTRSDMKINLISESLGYSDSPNFIRSFKKWTGLTPGIYRDNFCA